MPKLCLGAFALCIEGFLHRLSLGRVCSLKAFEDDSPLIPFSAGFFGLFYSVSSSLDFRKINRFIHPLFCVLN